MVIFQGSFLYLSSVQSNESLGFAEALVTPGRKDCGVARENGGEMLIVFEVSDPQEEETAQCCVAQTSELLTPTTNVTGRKVNGSMQSRSGIA